MPPLTAELLLQAYARGYFPMAKDRDDPEIYWFYPEKRGVIPLGEFHVPKSLEKFLKKNPFHYTVNQEFPKVIRACAEREDGTWINGTIIDLYTELWKMGHAHSVECWQKDTLAGGLYGVSLGGAFFGESMFSRMPNASKAALVHLVTSLKTAGYTLLDTQYVNEHLQQFGIIEIAREEYLKRLEVALSSPPNGGVWSSQKTGPRDKRGD